MEKFIDSVRQVLPAVTNDSDITSIVLGGISPSGPQPQSIMLAAVHQARLSKIVSGVLKDLYGIRRQTIGAQLRISRQYDGQLHQWRHNISQFLDSTDASLLRMIFQRQHTALRLAYAHAKILVHRPFLLGGLVCGNKSSTGDQITIEKNIGECIDAACCIAQIVHGMCEGKQMFQAFWVCF